MREMKRGRNKAQRKLCRYLERFVMEDIIHANFEVIYN